MDDQGKFCTPDLLWGSTRNEVKVRASKQAFAQCDPITVLVEPVGGFDPEGGLEDVVWNMRVEGVQNAEEIDELVDEILEDVRGDRRFELGPSFTARLDVGAKVTLAAFVEGMNLSVVVDQETINVVAPPHLELSY